MLCCKITVFIEKWYVYHIIQQGTCRFSLVVLDSDLTLQLTANVGQDSITQWKIFLPVLIWKTFQHTCVICSHYSLFAFT